MPVCNRIEEPCNFDLLTYSTVPLGQSFPNHSSSNLPRVPKVFHLIQLCSIWETALANLLCCAQSCTNLSQLWWSRGLIVSYGIRFKWLIWEITACWPNNVDQKCKIVILLDVSIEALRFMILHRHTNLKTCYWELRESFRVPETQSFLVTIVTHSNSCLHVYGVSWSQ